MWITCLIWGTSLVVSSVLTYLPGTLFGWILSLRTVRLRAASSLFLSRMREGKAAKKRKTDCSQSRKLIEPANFLTIFIAPYWREYSLRCCRTPLPLPLPLNKLTSHNQTIRAQSNKNRCNSCQPREIARENARENARQPRRNWFWFLIG